jgi:serine/threonine-protein kinase
MEFVEGVTLEQRLRDSGPLAAPEAVYYISQALSALEYAHANGVIHRDIKPANMIVTPGGVLKVMDFGIAKGAADHKLTQTGTTLGSLYYMSPEQIQGAASLDGRADLYSVGVSLYELVTGRRPFEGDSQFAIMSAHLEKTPVPPIALDPRVPQGLNDVILVSVARDPSERFQTAGAFRNALANAVPASQPAQAQAAAATAPAAAFAAAEAPRVIEPIKPAAKGGKRGLWMGIGAVAAVLAAVALIEFGPWHGSKAAPPPGASSVPPIVTQAPAAASAPAAEPLATEPAAQPPLQAPAPAARIPKTPAGVVARPRTSAGEAPARQAVAPAQQPPPPVPQTQPPPVQQAPAPVAARPAESGPSRAELQAAREQIVMLNTRAGSVRTSLQSLQRSQARGGQSLRADMQQASSLMNSYLQGATEAFNANDLAAAKSLMDKAEAQIDKLESFLGR